MTALRSGFLMEDFVSLYEAVASLRLAQREGRLAAYLGTPDGAPLTSGADFARRASALLSTILEGQLRRGHSHGTEEQRQDQRTAVYAAAALVDEVFILEEDWAGRDAWLDELIEYRLFRSRIAGQRYFDLAHQIILDDSSDQDKRDLAAIYLLALRLGFKGRYRGSERDHHELCALREALLKRVGQSVPESEAHRQGEQKLEARFCPQAYEFSVSGKDRRLAPLKPWFRSLKLALLAYLFLSSAIWFALIEPFLARHGGY